MTPYPPPATSSHPGLVQLPSGMSALSDWLDQELKEASSPTFAAIHVEASAQAITIAQGLAADDDSLQVGHDVLTATTTGVYNVGVGMHVGSSVQDGSYNSLFGNTVAQDLVSGDKNVFVGYNLSGVTNKDSNVIIGSDITAGNSDRQILIGHAVVPEGANKTVIGSDGQTNAHVFGTLTIGDGTDATKTATFDCSGIAAGTNRTLTLPNASGTLLYAGGPLGTPSSATLTNATGLPVSTGVSGLGSNVAAFLATPSSANLASAVTDETGSGSLVFAASPTLTNATINQAANGDTAIKSVRNTDTSPTGNFLDFQSAAAASVYKVDRFGALTVNVTAQASTAERLLTFGVSDSGSSFTLDNGTTNAAFFNPTFNGTIEAGVEGVPISFFGTKGVDTATNPAILFLGRHNTGGGNTDLSATVPLAEFRNRATSLLYVYGNGDLKLVKSGAVIGYGTGAGGAVTQATSRTTGVTLSKATGAITTNTTSLAAGASATFTVTNTVVTALDVVNVAIKSGQTNKETSVAVTAVAAGSFDITVYNQHASTAETGAIVINFVVIKGAVS